MNKASSSIVVFVFAALLVSFQSFAQSRGPGRGQHHEPERGPGRFPERHESRELQVRPHSVINLRVNDLIYNQGDVALKRLVKEQLGLSLEGAEIEQITVHARSISRQRAFVFARLNGAIVGQRRPLGSVPTIIPVRGVVRGSLQLGVQGTVEVSRVSLKIGRVQR